ncbi:MAG: hypothetical protein R2761_10605 [Acidimicrobiales bacterium]
MAQRVSFRRLQFLRLLQVLGLLGVLLVSQGEWARSDTGTVILASSPGVDGTTPGLAVLLPSAVALIWTAVQWLLGRTSTKVASFAGAVVMGVVVHQLLTIPHSAGLGGGVNHIGPAVWDMGVAALIVLTTTTALVQLRRHGSGNAADGAQPATVEVSVVAVGILLFALGSLLPWRHSGEPMISAVENEVWLGSTFGFGTILSAVSGLAFCMVAIAIGRRVRGPIEIVTAILALIAISLTQDLWANKYVGAGTGAWLMAGGAAVAILATFAGYCIHARQPRVGQHR